ncbi:hypothetical protein BGZ65_004725, partial [Modicella reniformis]
MEKRALRSSARLAAQAAAQAATTADSSDTHPDQGKNTEVAPSSSTAMTARHRALYKPNPLVSQTAKEGVNRR